MEYHVHDDDRHYVAPWVWILIVLLAIILIFVIWWAVAAQSPQRTVVVPGQEQPVTPPVQQPAQQPPAQPTQAAPPQVVERPVTIYVERGQAPSTVYIVPKGEQPPQATQRLSLPGEFIYEGRNWKPSDTALTSDTFADTGASVAGNTVYAGPDDQPPYSALYLETQPGSGVYVEYKPM